MEGNGKKRRVILADLDEPMADVILPSTGRTVKVYGMSGFAMQLYRQMQDMVRPVAEEGTDAIPDADLEKIPWRLAALLVPDATEAEVSALRIAVVAGLISIALGNVEAVEAMVEKGKARLRALEGGPVAPSPETPSATSSPASPEPVPAASGTS